MFTTNREDIFTSIPLASLAGYNPCGLGGFLFLLETYVQKNFLGLASLALHGFIIGI